MRKRTNIFGFWKFWADFKSHFTLMGYCSIKCYVVAWSLLLFRSFIYFHQIRWAAAVSDLLAYANNRDVQNDIVLRLLLFHCLNRKTGTVQWRFIARIFSLVILDTPCDNRQRSDVIIACIATKRSLQPRPNHIIFKFIMVLRIIYIALSNTDFINWYASLAFSARIASSTSLSWLLAPHRIWIEIPIETM